MRGRFAAYDLFISSAFQGSMEEIGKVHEKADAILAKDPEDWLRLEMYFMKFEADMRNYPVTMYDTKNEESIREMIKNNRDFAFYESILCDYLSIRAHLDGSQKERVECINKGLYIAEKHDDRVRVAHLLIRKADVSEREEARRLLERAYSVVDESLGIPANYADILNRLSALEAIRGDFDKAIRRSLQVVSIRERAGLNTGNSSLLLSVLYNIVGEPESGLEWAQMAEEQLKSRPFQINRAIAFQIWSLILLKKIPEAEILLDTSRESMLKSGYRATCTLRLRRSRSRLEKQSST